MEPWLSPLASLKVIVLSLGLVGDMRDRNGGPALNFYSWGVCSCPAVPSGVCVCVCTYLACCVPHKFPLMGLVGVPLNSFLY